MQEIITATDVFEVPTWQLVYSEVSPEAYTYTGTWERRWMEFTSVGSWKADDLVATAKPIIEEYFDILNVQLWQEGIEETADRWYVDITLIPKAVLTPQGYVRPTIAWVPVAIFLGLLGGAGIFGQIIGKGGSSGGGLFGGITEMIMPIMLMGMMFMFMPMMTAARE